MLSRPIPVRDCGKQAWVEENLGCKAVVTEASIDPIGSAGAGTALLKCAEVRQRRRASIRWADLFLEEGFPGEGV